MFKKIVIVGLLLISAGCGGSEGSSQLNSPQDQAVAETTKEILSSGVAIDLTALIRGSYNMYSIASSNFFVVTAESTTLSFSDTITVTDIPSKSSFDPQRFKFYAASFLNYPGDNPQISSDKKQCNDRGGNFLTTPIDEVEWVYGGVKDLSISYEVLEEETTKLKVTAIGKKFESCCDLPVGLCNSIDFSAPPFERTINFLVKGATAEGFVLEQIRTDGAKVNTYLSFIRR